MYDVKSRVATEFIDNKEILDTIAYAKQNKSNRKLIEQLIHRAKDCKGLTHREAAVLLECDQADLNEQMFHLAKQIKQKLYGNRIVMFAPLYLSNYCVNGCTYCPYHAKNKHISRKKLTQEDIVREVTALQDMGHKRLAIEAGEDPLHNPISYILECIDTIYHIHHKNGAIRRVNVNIAATTEEEYHMLKEAGIGTKRAMKSCIPPDRNTTTTITPRQWIVPWQAALTMWGWACCSGWKTIPMSWWDCSCTQSIWRQFTA